MKVRLENLTKKFEEVTAVNDATLEFLEGKLTGLLGPSGCGKSTTLYLIAGLFKATSGKIFFDDEDVTRKEPEKRGIGLVFQNYALYPHMTAEQNIMFPLQNLKVPKKEARKRALDMAKLVHISELLNRKPGQMSGGQQQRVAIARALVKEPRILLLDEPLSNLDARLRLEMREEIKRIQRETGVTTIFVTHDQEEAMSISDQIAIMNEGLLQQVASPQEMYRNPVNEFVAKFLGNPPINIIETEIKGGKVDAGGFLMNTGTLPDQPVHVGVRPESFRLDANGSVKAVVQAMEYTGRETLLFAYLGEKLCKVIINADIIFKKGDSVSLSLKEKSMLLFDLEGNRLYV
ncbi:MAG: ABC transporter ATP-binding protein [Clostridia bacterium]|nr:ABC transporter ATP-binding protein [Clostridia bacterium]MBN2882220.1 ABC transporter ATP-binding protein [Clostridia bacterium]